MKKIKKYKKETPKYSAKNSKILHDTMVTLGALKEADRLHDLPMHEIQVHLLDKDGDGIVLCLEYDEHSGELNKTFHSIDEAAYDEYGEPHDDVVIEVELENTSQRAKFEEGISEEYDEIFHSAESFNGKKRSRLLN